VPINSLEAASSFDDSDPRHGGMLLQIDKISECHKFSNWTI